LLIETAFVAFVGSIDPDEFCRLILLAIYPNLSSPNAVPARLQPGFVLGKPGRGIGYEYFVVGTIKKSPFGPLNIKIRSSF
jgi:hypothetical protein